MRGRAAETHRLQDGEAGGARMVAQALAAVEAGPGYAEKVEEIRELGDRLREAVDEALRLEEALENPQGKDAVEKSLETYAADAIQEGRREVTTCAFKGMENALVDFVQTGKI